MLRAGSALLVVLALALVPGCGGPDIAYTEVKSAPETMPIPEDTGTAVAATDADAEDDDSNVTTSPTDEEATGGTTATDPATTTPVTPPTTTTTTPPATDDGTGETGGTTPTTPAPEEPSTDTGGATADEDQFCAANPGACNGE